MTDKAHEISPSSVINREKLDGLISFAANLRQALIDQPDPIARTGNARALLDVAKEVFRELMGKDASRLVYGDDPPVEALEPDHLNALAGRLGLLEDIFCGANKSAPSSLSQAKEEIEAISHGDRARLFAPRPGSKGKPNNAYRLALCQLRALEWQTYLQSHGWTVADSQNAVATAFGATWTTIVRWREPIAHRLGEGKLNAEIEQAKRMKPFTSNYFESDAETGDLLINEPTIEEQIKIHGDEYLTELKRR